MVGQHKISRWPIRLLQVILLAVGYSWPISYRTAAIAFRWVGGSQKVQNVLGSLVASGELAEIRNEAARIHMVCILGCISQDPVDDSRTYLKKILQRRQKRKIERTSQTYCRYPKKTLQRS